MTLANGATCCYTNGLVRYWDTYGRDAGYSLNGERQSTIGYDASTGRLVTMLAAGSTDAFQWSYLDGDDLKLRLDYPNEISASWEYNERGELTNAVSRVDTAYRYAYSYDDIGNRMFAVERGTNTIYAANCLNQYTNIVEQTSVSFEPQFDADGNQTLVKTATGVWQITYNGENRPILWVQGTNSVSMSYDRLGRRVMKNDRWFTYNGYLQIADNRGNSYVWDPTESIATRPLIWNNNDARAYYTHDGKKNVSEVVDSDCTLSAHYEYAPFGAQIVSCGKSARTNPWRFSGEKIDDDLGCCSYVYRPLNTIMGIWMSRDLIEEDGGANLYAYCRNSPMLYDALGLTNMPGDFGWGNYSSKLDYLCCCGKRFNPAKSCCIDGEIVSKNPIATGVTEYWMYGRIWYYFAAPIIRPHHPEQRGLIHAWLSVDVNGSDITFGAYPNNYAPNGIRQPDDHEKDKDSTETLKFDVLLSPCDYDIEVFKECILSKKDRYYNWSAWNNCGDFVKSSVRECAKKARKGNE